MTTSDTKKAQILAALLTIAGLTWFYGFRMHGPATMPPRSKPRSIILSRPIKETTIQIGSIHDPGIDEVGHKNIFQYGQKPSSQRTGAIPDLVRTATDTPRVGLPLHSASQQRSSKTFKYEGFSVRSTPANGRMLASLSDGGNTYIVRLGECLMGRYCIRALTENMIEIEDLETHQSLAFAKTLQ